MFERFGNGRNIEIIINDELLKMLIELQNQFTKLKEMDNDKYKGRISNYLALLRKNGEIAKH